MNRTARLTTLAVALLVAAPVGLAAPAAAAHHHHHRNHATSSASRESHALGLAAPARGAARRHAWGAWIGAWRTADGQIVYHLDPQARRGRARYGSPTEAPELAYHRKPVPATNQQEAAWILSRYGAVMQRSQDAATELAIDDLLVGGKYALDGAITRTRLLRLDDSTRSDVLRLAGQMLANVAQLIGPYQVHVAKAGASTATSMPVAVTVTSASGHPLPGAQVAVAGSPASATTGARGEPAQLVVARPSTTQQLAVTVTVPDATLHVRAPRQHRLSRAAVAGSRTTVSGTATVTPPTTWTLTSEQYVQTVPYSDTRTWQTLYSGTFQDSWTCTIQKGATTCQDPAGDACSHNVPLNSGTWTDSPSVPPDGYRGGNTCVWRHYTVTSSRVVQTGGTVTQAQYDWRPASSTYADGAQAASALGACQADPQHQRGCSLSDNGSVTS